MDCYLVVMTSGDLQIPDQFKDSHVKLSAPNVCVVADSSSTTKEIAKLFGIERSGDRGVVVKLDHYSGTESNEIVDRWDTLESR